MKRITLELNPATITLLVAVIFVIFSLVVFLSRKDEKKANRSTGSQKIAVPIKIEITKPPISETKSKAIRPADPYEIEKLRQELNIPEEEEKDTLKTQEEISEKDPQVKFVF